MELEDSANHRAQAQSADQAQPSQEAAQQEPVSKPEEEVKNASAQQASDSSSEEEEAKMDPATQQMWKKIDDVLDEYYLSNFQLLAVKKFIKDKVGNSENKVVDRVRNWLFMRLNGKKMPDEYHPRQLGCPDLVPGLSLKAWWDRSEFEWIARLEQQAGVIREELLALRSTTGFQPYRSPAYANTKNIPEDKIGSNGHDSGNWNVFYLFLHDIKFEENCAKVPRTIEILRSVIPRNYFHAFFSALTPGSHVTPHNGPTGKKLRVHLPLLGTEGARMRVGDEIKHLRQDECIIFDDSFNHEAWYDGDSTRINLILDFWHPELSDDEVKFFSMLLKSKLKGDRILSEKAKNEDHLYAIIDKTKDILKQNDDWWVN